MISSKRAKIKVPNRLDLPGQKFENLWEVLRDAIDRIYESEVHELSFEQLYRTVYSLILGRKAFELYAHLEGYLGEKLDELKRKNLEETEGFELLQKLFDIWEAQCRCFKLISDVMIYMDKVYCKYERKMETYDLGLELFKKHVVDPIKEKVNGAMLSDIDEARSQGSLELPHASIWKGIVGMMETLEDGKDNYFLVHFEPTLLRRTEAYYRNAINFHEISPIQYLETMKRLKSFEFSLDQKFVNTDTAVKVATALENVLIWTERFMEAIPILIRDALTNNSGNLLGELCSLSSEEKYCARILECIKNCIWEDANSLNVDRNSKKRAQIATQWTTKVIQLYNYYESLLSPMDSHIFTFDENQDNSSLNVINEMIGKYLNEDTVLTCEFITLHLDMLAKSTKDKRDIDHVKEELEECVKIFKLISEKDVFEDFYKKQMSKRLLHQRSSIKLEKWLVKKIKDEMGSFLTSKLDGMLRDINLSAGLSRSFKHEDFLPGCFFTSQILTMTSWPFQTANFLHEDVILPLQMLRLKEQFEVFYSEKYNDRTLRWAHHLGFMEIVFNFGNGCYEISMPMYAGIIFFLFEDHEELTARQILELTNIPQQELQRQLISLSMSPKSRILKKKPQSRTVSPADIFSINYGFTSLNRKIKLQTIATKSDIQSQSEQETLEREKITQTNAAIVRIMKSCRESGHDQLFQMVSDALNHRFVLTSQIFKRSVANLLSKEYLQRDSDDADIYRYVA